ncbi:MAG: type III-B CRISPR module RAMP protein Cmr4 [Thermoanaerobaculia bacterium]|nr:MAG: type III-B CRISPR module RAMP protein Cmr4 [Thermoanaerobaculia bacterium]MBZ0102125.1 type III-B CRISPR module RAMP protein Cmr4 [Thermoanaerobaculia bacterium]
MITRPYLLHALSALHAGTGQGVGPIDLPIARERTTDHPIVPGSSIKGVLREAARAQAADRVDAIFGSAEGNASMVRVSDARTLAFPVKSDRGTFAWITSRYALLRYARDAGEVGFTADQVPVVADGKAVTEDGSVVLDGSRVTLDGLPYERVAPSEGAKKVFGALARAVFPGEDLTNKAWRLFFSERVVIVSDDAFTWLTQTATDVRAHVRIDDKTGTVAKGALWYAETLPPETILAGIVQVGALRKDQDPKGAFDLLNNIAASPLQVGGDATTGAGRVRLVICGDAA